ncbi:MAG: roadblock/LC7 domain-containing protein [Kiritimatiellae bacterium]|nr:roadblock/LC7 domain-containing protein [Kiritimatiellia bacterium]
MNLTLAEGEMHAVRRALAWLSSQAEPDSCILCDSAGNVIEREGQGPWESALVTALAAGVYGASRELARILGQEEFDSVLNQGEKTSIFFQSVTEDLLLVTVFSETASTGLVKLYAAQAAEMLRRALAGTRQPAGNPGGSLPPLVLKNDGDMFRAGTQETQHAEPCRARQAVG